MEDIERIKERLDNIHSVRPIISALRTIAAGSWRVALRRQQASEAYIEHLSEVLAALLARLSPADLRHPAIRPEPVAFRRPLILVIASERGLCGAFNDTVLEGAERLIAQQRLQSDEVLVATLGQRAAEFFRRHGIEPVATFALPVTRVASPELVRDVASALLTSFYNGEADAVFVLYSPYRPASTLPPVAQRWVPLDPSFLPARAESWPEPIFETPPEVVLKSAVEAWIQARVYQAVMASSASEHSARYRAMENASNNIERLVSDLTVAYHSARQHAITLEMLDLVASSGMLRRRPGEE